MQLAQETNTQSAHTYFPRQPGFCLFEFHVGDDELQWLRLGHAVIAKPDCAASQSYWFKPLWRTHDRGREPNPSDAPDEKSDIGLG